jgi:hypothetical protein
MRTIEQIIELLNIKTKSLNLKKVLYDKYIKQNINYSVLNQYPELLSIFKNSFKIDLKQIDWYHMSMYQKLSESFISEFKDNLKWYHISKFQKLTEDFIRENKDNVNWDYISKYQNLSESFIIEFKNKVSWSNISAYQKLTESFITKFQDKVQWSNISHFQKLSKSFIKKHNLKLNYDSWLYKDGDFKLEAIRNTGLYVVIDDYVYGFKGIRSNRYSAFNFQYQYFSGVEYECHADFNNNHENSFGLSVWTKEKATEYCDELVIEVKIHKDDLAALVHNGGKIRCQKFTILS